MQKLRLLTLLAALAMAGCCCASKGPVVISASDKAAVQAAMPTVTVVGVVESVNATESVVTINFENTKDSQFCAVVLYGGREAVEAAFGGDIAKAITGKTIHVTGNVVLYRGRPEIVISKPEQLAVVK
jgi:DNA/RNA endonuclease YhcR with UshA esterase domain